MRFDLWTPPRLSGIVVRLGGEDLRWLIDFYGGSQPSVFEAVVAHVKRLGAGHCLVEYRYMDADYRNEHSQFYSTTFRRYPTIAHRIHFFKGPPTGDTLEAALERLQPDSYLGYAVMRPVPAAPVGRTMLPPLRSQSDAVTCLATDVVDLFGYALAVHGAPFVSQDGQLGRCAQATVWVTAYHHRLAFGGPRVLPGDIDRAIEKRLQTRRHPSPGLSVAEIGDAARAVGMPTLTYSLRELRRTERTQDALPLLRRYLDSGLPVTIVTRAHAFVVVGYEETEDAFGRPVATFLRQDDMAGPYEAVNWLEDVRYGAWQYALVPLPRKVYLAGEEAEIVALRGLRNALQRSVHLAAIGLRVRIDGDPALRTRTYVVRSNHWKETLTARGYSTEVAAAYRSVRMPRWVWVTELYDATGEQGTDVVAEALVDSTEHPRDAHLLARRVPGSMQVWDGDLNESCSLELHDDSNVLESYGSGKFAELHALLIQVRPCVV